jgi:hypothetical protein
MESEGEVTSLSGADKREVRDNREKWWEYREKSKYFSNCTTFHIRRALSWHSYVIMYIYKNYVEIREGMGQLGATTFDCQEKSMESWIETKHFVFCSDYNPPMDRNET